MVNIMLLIKKGETASKSTNAQKDEDSSTGLNGLVDCVHSTVHKSLNKDERFEMKWTLNFDGMTDAQIIEAAAEHFIIKIRRDFAKVDKPENDEWNNVEFLVSKYLTKRTSKIDKMAKTLADFSDEQLAALGLSRT